MESGAVVRNLDQIQEADPSERGSRLGALLLASVGGVGLVLATVMVLRSPSEQAPEAQDPLGDLVANARPMAEDGSKVGDVTFPELLTDADRPTTALEAVRDKDFKLPPGAPTEPPPAMDQLPVVPLPAGEILESDGVRQPDDVLSTMARSASRDDGTEVEAGAPGGYQLQVSSFKNKIDAESFASALRRRGHKAYVEAAYVKDRGLWHRVRIGPFKHKHSADLYRQDFEAKERLVTFVVSPPKTTVKIAD